MRKSGMVSVDMTTRAGHFSPFGPRGKAYSYLKLWEE
jgi:hypothetical protein